MLVWHLILLAGQAAALYQDVSSSSHFSPDRTIRQLFPHLYKDNPAINDINTQSNRLVARGERFPGPQKSPGRGASGRQNDTPQPASRSSSPSTSSDGRGSPQFPARTRERSPNMDHPMPNRATSPTAIPRPQVAVPRLDLSTLRPASPVNRRPFPEWEPHRNPWHDPSKQISEAELRQLFPPSNSPTLDLSVFRPDHPANRLASPPRQRLYHNPSYSPSQAISDKRLRELFPHQELPPVNPSVFDLPHSAGQTRSQSPRRQEQEHRRPAARSLDPGRSGNTASNARNTVAGGVGRTPSSPTSAAEIRSHEATQSMAAASNTPQRLVFSRLTPQRTQRLTPYQNFGQSQQTATAQFRDQRPIPIPFQTPDRMQGPHLIQIPNPQQNQQSFQGPHFIQIPTLHRNQRPNEAQTPYQTLYPSRNQQPSQIRSSYENPYPSQSQNPHQGQSQFQGQDPYQRQIQYQSQTPYHVQGQFRSQSPYHDQEALYLPNPMPYVNRYLNQNRLQNQGTFQTPSMPYNQYPAQHQFPSNWDRSGSRSPAGPSRAYGMLYDAEYAQLAAEARNLALSPHWAPSQAQGTASVLTQSRNRGLADAERQREAERPSRNQGSGSATNSNSPEDPAQRILTPSKRQRRT